MRLSQKRHYKSEQLPLDLGARTAHGLEDFLIGASNKDAVRWIDLWPKWPAPMLVLSGPAASGKTHLGAVWQGRTNAVVIKPEMLLSKTADQIAYCGKHLLLDSLDPWLGDRDAETTLFHIYNIFKEEKRSFLVTMRMAPSCVDFAVADLASRFRAAPVASIQAPDDMLLASVLIKNFSDYQLKVSNDVIKYTLPRMERSFKAARDIACSADRMALAQKKGVSIPLIRQVLSEL